MDLPARSEAHTQSGSQHRILPGFSPEARRNFCKLDWNRKLKIVFTVGMSVAGCVLDFGLAFSGKRAGWALLSTAIVFTLAYFLVRKESNENKPPGPLSS